VAVVKFMRRALLKVQMLVAEVVAVTGGAPKLKSADAMMVGQLVRMLAQRVAIETDLDRAREWGLDFRRRAEIIDVDLNSQPERYRAFEYAVRRGDEIEKSRMVGEQVADKALLMRHTRTGEEYTVASWFTAYVRQREGSAFSPQAIATLMARAGWAKHGQRGDVKATRPGFPGSLKLRLWRIPVGWPDPVAEATGPHTVTEKPSDAGESPQVPTSTHEEPKGSLAHAISNDLRGPGDLASQEGGDLRGPEPSDSLDDSIGGAW
jgi:hypothetical protein